MPIIPDFRREIGKLKDVQQQQIVESKVNGGVITQIDSRDIPTSALQKSLNTFCRYDKTGRRIGSVLLDPTKPNSQPVTKLSFMQTADGAPYSVRMTPTTIHTLNVGGWSGIAISPALMGGVNDRFLTADILDTFVFTNNGANFPQTVDFGAGSCGPLGNFSSVYTEAPRFVIGFFDRAVFLALKDAAEATVVWSADGTPTQFDPTVDQTAGSSPIIESPDDLSDFITGAVAFTNVAIIMRQRSIWLATKQPVPTDPFYFFSAVPGKGCDCSYSIQLIGNGAVWTDTRKREVYAYTPGGAPEVLSDNIRNDLFKNITDPTAVFSDYNESQSEYSLFIPIAGNVTRAYTYNFDIKTWVINEFYGVTAAADFEVATGAITIDELVGPIDSLVGTIDELSTAGPIIQTHAYGRNDGSIALEDPTVDTDAPHTDFPSGVPYTTQMVSKLFQFPEQNITISKINLSYQCSRTTTILFEYSRDNGATWVTGKTMNTTIFGKPLNFSFRKAVRCANLMWRLTYSSSDLQVLGYEVYAFPSGDTRTNQ